MDAAFSETWKVQRAALGTFLRTQRELSNLSLRELSRLTRISNAYLSQIERGLHDPTLRVLLQIGDALQISLTEILSAGGASHPADAGDASPAGAQPVEAAIRVDPHLTAPEKDALLTVYRSYLHSHERDSR
ncbi:helix-turn-helix transcriptional regulator [Mycobacterium sp.]|uniref:helix-turn-helix domain-containing protein n=1 Tax=Mycobacterium sp. TaxID=1785 RepID=UPI002C0AE09F|nr:helix-turn-helix transcriptional regulator [Mycobacterium sp.]HTQ21440.1 helix-turn-helix transcriptional regulator [Mycobacterium sp.]